MDHIQTESPYTWITFWCSYLIVYLFYDLREIGGWRMGDGRGKMESGGNTMMIAIVRDLVWCICFFFILSFHFLSLR